MYLIQFPQIRYFTHPFTYIFLQMVFIQQQGENHGKQQHSTGTTRYS